MKMIKVIAIVLMISINAFGQDVKEAESKMEAFASKTGVILKFQDYNLSGMNLTYGAAEARISKISSGSEPGYFYIVSAKGQYGEKSAAIADSDLLEIIKALETLKRDAVVDAATNADYLENKFVTSDGFQLGYYVSKGKTKWYMVLERYKSDNTIFINDVSTIEKAFSEAKAKIENLKG